MEITTPRGKIIRTQYGTAKLVWSNGFQTAANRKLSKGGQLQQFIDSTVLRGCEPYVPMHWGVAKKSGILHTAIGSGSVIWKTPYIRVIYYGKVMAGPRSGSKYPTGKDLVYDTSRGGKRGKLWCERYKTDHLSELRRAVCERAKGGFS